MDERINRALVLGSQLAAVLAVVIGAAFQKNRLLTARPAGPATQVTFPDEAGDRYARLWEDPLRSLESFVPKTEEGLTTLSNPEEKQAVGVDPTVQMAFNKGRLPSKEFELLPEKREPRVFSTLKQGLDAILPGRKSNNEETSTDLVLWNVLEGIPTPEARERRVRTRYAVSTTLASLGYQPLLDSKLDSISFRVRSGKEKSVEKLLSIGYLEVFENRSEGIRHPRVFVAWHPQTKRSLGRDWKFPIDTPKEAQRALARAELMDYRPSPGARTVVINNGSSDRLIEFLGRKDYDPQSEVCFVRATLDPSAVSEALQDDSDSTKGDDQSSFEKMARRHVAMTSDLLTIRALAEELRQRFHGMDRDDGRLVVFTESDSAYGRNLAQIVRDEFKNDLDETRIEVYSYLRGLDGLREDDSSTREEDPGGPIGTSLGTIEDPWGSNQYDYLRRLARTLFTGPNRQGPVLAVGVLGSDPFDKLLVLQALQSEIPDALGFTTDLDSYFFHQNHLSYTRNLLIGAGEPLLCRDDPPKRGETQWEIPPMRDSYQAGLVRIIRAITRGTPVPQLTKPMPRVWEVGMGRLVEMPPVLREELREASGCEPGNSQDFSRRVLPFVGGLLFAILLLAAILCRLQSENGPQTCLTQRARFFVYLASITSGLGTLLILSMTSSSMIPGKEPLVGVCLAGSWISLILWMRLPPAQNPVALPPNALKSRICEAGPWLLRSSIGFFALLVTGLMTGLLRDSETGNPHFIPTSLLTYATLALSAGAALSKIVTAQQPAPPGKACEDPPARIERNVLVLVFFTLLLMAVTIHELTPVKGGFLPVGWIVHSLDNSDAGFFLGEPLDPISGISIWPAVVLRGLAFFIGALLLLFTSRTFFEEGRHGVAKIRELNIRTRHPVKCDFGTRVLDSTDSLAGFSYPLLGPLLGALFGGPEDRSLSGQNPGEMNQKTHLADFLDHFLNPYRKLIRVALAAAVYFALSAVLFSIWPPNVPVRGEGAFWFERISLAFGVGLYIVHLVFCVELHLCALGTICWMRSALKAEPTLAGSATLREVIEITGRLTRVVGLTLLYPLSILSLLLLSRLRIFDDWTMTPSLLITLFLGAALLVSVALGLVGNSWKLRSDILDSLENQAGDYHPSHENDLKEIRDHNAGAFAPWFRQPIFTAILGGLLVFGGVGAADSFVELWSN